MIAKKPTLTQLTVKGELLWAGAERVLLVKSFLLCRLKGITIEGVDDVSVTCTFFPKLNNINSKLQVILASKLWLERILQRDSA